MVHFLFGNCHGKGWWWQMCLLWYHFGCMFFELAHCEHASDMVPIKFFEVSIQPIFWKICQIAITRHVHVVSRLDKKLNMNMVNRSLILRNFALWRIKWKRNVLTLKAFNWYIWLPCHVSYKHSLFGFIATRFIHCPWHLIFSHSSKTKRSFVKQIGSLSSLFSPLKSSIANMALWELKYWV